TGGYFVVEAFNFKTDLLQVVDNVIAHRDGLVIRSDREVSVVDADLVAAVGAAVHHGFLAGAPPTFIRVHEVEGVVYARGIADGIKDVELSFRTDGTGIGDTGFLQVFLRVLRDRARVEAIGSLGEWIPDKD